MLKHTTYQSIYNHDFSKPVGRGWKLGEQFRVLQTMFTRQLFLKLFLVAVIMIAGCTGMVRVFASSSQDDIPMEKVVVSRGDTLWGIARDFKPKDMDTRSYINVIKGINHLKTSGIEAGDVLSLPIY
ncbi:LysM peptidoglycan-binding domain-containing protein [Paenibacillus sp.]|jgi:hypothetical protein|uniref:LysM peptidoglycan-binding domain-containing protein n=1 Tax=Paenibacillus sp. TaxID=58172 RepID=UPI002819FB82|nr:LysM peptidoglycan-binding domain-containing protein [Paenibacillus sp.]MDR0267696.1 LysM peptidoglycan-binding domain-containing protein [Paenibacillus sp.]